MAETAVTLPAALLLLLIIFVVATMISTNIGQGIFQYLDKYLPGQASGGITPDYKTAYFSTGALSCALKVVDRGSPDPCTNGYQQPSALGGGKGVDSGSTQTGSSDVMDQLQESGMTMGVYGQLILDSRVGGYGWMEDTDYAVSLAEASDTENSKPPDTTDLPADKRAWVECNTAKGYPVIEVYGVSNYANLKPEERQAKSESEMEYMVKFLYDENDNVWKWAGPADNWMSFKSVDEKAGFPSSDWWLNEIRERLRGMNFQDGAKKILEVVTMGWGAFSSDYLEVEDASGKLWTINKEQKDTDTNKFISCSTPDALVGLIGKDPHSENMWMRYTGAKSIYFSWMGSSKNQNYWIVGNTKNSGWSASDWKEALSENSYYWGDDEKVKALLSGLSDYAYDYEGGLKEIFNKFCKSQSGDSIFVMRPDQIKNFIKITYPEGKLGGKVWGDQNIFREGDTGSLWWKYPVDADMFADQVGNKERTSQKCIVHNFMLPQYIDNAETWISGYGDPETLIYYSQFPRGEDGSWTSFNTWFHNAITITMFAVPLGNIAGGGVKAVAGAVGKLEGTVLSRIPILSRILNKASSKLAAEAELASRLKRGVGTILLAYDKAPGRVLRAQAVLQGLEKSEYFTDAVAALEKSFAKSTTLKEGIVKYAKWGIAGGAATTALMAAALIDSINAKYEPQEGQLAIKRPYYDPMTVGTSVSPKKPVILDKPGDFDTSFYLASPCYADLTIEPSYDNEPCHRFFSNDKYTYCERDSGLGDYIQTSMIDTTCPSQPYTADIQLGKTVSISTPDVPDTTEFEEIGNGMFFVKKYKKVVRYMEQTITRGQTTTKEWHYVDATEYWCHERGLTKAEESFGIGENGKSVFVCENTYSVETQSPGLLPDTETYFSHTKKTYYWELNDNVIGKLFAVRKTDGSEPDVAYRENGASYNLPLKRTVNDIALIDVNRDSNIDLNKNYEYIIDNSNTVDDSKGPDMSNGYMKMERDTDSDGRYETFEGENCVVRSSLKVSVDKKSGEKNNFCYSKKSWEMWAVIAADIAVDIAWNLATIETAGISQIGQGVTSLGFAFIYVHFEHQERWPG